MTGLLIKDWKLLKNQGRSYVLMIAFVLVICFYAGSGEYTAFMTSYLTFLFSMFAISTFTYDEADNGIEFLMALPVTRKMYVTEKYLFGFLLTSGAWVFSVLLRMGILMSMGGVNDWGQFFCEEPVYLIVVLYFIGYSLPVMIKYGAEKGRNISMGLLGLIAIIIFLWAKSGRNIAVLKGLAESADRAPIATLGILAAVGILLFALSFFISLRAMEKKEF